MLRTIKKKSLLYKSKVEYADFCINHVLGCAHGCTYPCYAMMMAKRFGKIKDYKDWLEPKIVSNALGILDEEILKYRNQIDFVHLCFTTDPFMYGHSEVEDLSLQIIKKLNENGIKTTVLTKGAYPKVLAQKEQYGYNNEYGISVVSLNEGFKGRFEPFSASFEERIESLKYLHDAGLKTWVSIEPYPTPNIIEQDLSELLNAVSFVEKIIFGKLNYNFKAKGYCSAAEFYEACANSVVDFCRERSINCYIKNGTRIKSDKTTQHLSTGPFGPPLLTC